MQLTLQQIIADFNTAISHTTLIYIVIIIGIFILLIELNQRLRPSSPLKLSTYDWKISKTSYGLEVEGWLEINNPHQRMEVMVPELRITTKLLGKEGVSQIKANTVIKTFHPDLDSRKDGYWQAYIVKSKKFTRASILIELNDSDSIKTISVVENIWLNIHWVNYGPFGRLKTRQGTVVPIQRPTPLSPEKAYFRKYKDCQLLPIKTHLLSSNDNISDILKKYVVPIIRPGDVLTIGESPLAIIQGRYHHPSSIKPGIVARTLCRAFHPTSSLATACGLQVLIDLVSPGRVIFGFLIGLSGKMVGIKGIFYRLAGEQARLIDDITGTIPPYDQTIVLGPKAPNELCKNLSKELGINIAVVDVNDLGRVKILAASDNSQKKLLKKALRVNPAGNANEQTPLVLIRPYQKTKGTIV